MSASRTWFAALVAWGILGCGCGKQPADSRPYSERLTALLGPADPKRPLAPVRDGGDVVTIDPQAGSAAGMHLGQTMDEVISLWGLPHGLSVTRRLDGARRPLRRDVRLTYSGLTFGFRGDVLYAISVQNLREAHLAGGPRLEATRAEVLAALGEPKERRDDTVWIYERAELEVRLHFLKGLKDPEPLLTVIGIERPGVGDSTEL